MSRTDLLECVSVGQRRDIVDGRTGFEHEDTTYLALRSATATGLPPNAYDCVATRSILGFVNSHPPRPSHRTSPADSPSSPYSSVVASIAYVPHRQSCPPPPPQQDHHSAAPSCQTLMRCQHLGSRARCFQGCHSVRRDA